MSKRVRKKSAKLLESELDGIEDSLLAGGAKKKKKLPAALTSPKPLPKPKPDVTSDKKLVPKLTIKFGGGGKASVANNQKEPAAVSAKTLSTPPRQAEASKKLTPVLVINKSKLTSTTSGGPSEGKQQISDSKKTDTKSATVSPKPSSISSPGGSQGVIKKRQAPKKVTGKPKKQSNFPTDIEIEAPQETSPPLVKKEPTTPKPVKTPKKTNAPKTPVSKASPSIKPVTPKVQTPKLESKPITPKHAVKTELPMAEMSSPEQPSNKRQRKLPAKFAADDYDIDTDLHSINKAAKFFETKKAEAKAATGIAKHEASKSGKKVKRNRMPTAYTMWCNSYRAKLQAQCPGMDFVTMNKKLGEVWWSIPPKEKNCWKRKAKRLATHGAPKKGTDPLKYLGSKAIASLQRNNLLTAKNTKTQNTKKLSTIQNTPPVFKVTQTEPVDVAAHFQMLSDTFKSVGYSLKSNSKVQLSGSLTMLMDSLLCGVSSLMCLTQQVPELDGDTDPQTHRQRQSDIATFIPHA